MTHAAGFYVAQHGDAAASGPRVRQAASRRSEMREQGDFGSGRDAGVRRLAAAAFVSFAAGAALAFATHGFRRADVRRTPLESPGVVSIDEDGWRYTFHVATGTESLFELRRDPRMLHDVGAAHPDEARRLRAVLESRLHVESLESLRVRESETIRRLRSLGYL